MRYFDASALVKRYVREPGTARVTRLIASGAPATSRLSEVEVASAVGRRAREGAFSVTERDRALAALERDLAAILVVELTPDITARARALLLRHELRAGDAIQLASCLYLQEQFGEEVPFIAFDERLTGAARGEGLRTG
jgi:predicted nucleic acid-binding protein